VYVVDADPAELRAMTRRLELAGFTVEPFASPLLFLSVERTERPSCVVLDSDVAEADLWQVQQRLAAQPDPLPIVVLTNGGGDDAWAQAMEAQAVDFLTKPVSGDALVDAVKRALQANLDTRRARGDVTRTRALYSTLTTRQREVFALLTGGSPSKDVAAALGTSERTIKAHRAQIMAKMRVTSFADLVRAAARLGLRRGGPGGNGSTRR
jgi:FixJ family two-component response regulator